MNERPEESRPEFELHIVPGPGLAEDELVRERLEMNSPDGRPPSLQIRRETRRLFLMAFTVAAVVVLVAIYSWGGLGPTAVAILMTAIFIGLGAWPTWRAAMIRSTDETRARSQIAAERTGRARHAEDRSVSGG